MKRFVAAIVHNWPLKLLSVIIALLIWAAAVNNYDPRQTRSYSVKVEVVNEGYIVTGKQVYRIDDSYKTVTVYITGNKSELDKITESSISVTADLTQIVDMNTDPIIVPLQVSCEGFDRTDITLSRSTIPITIETISSTSIPVIVSTGDTSPNSNYEIASLTPNPSILTVYGPESVISQIDTIVAAIDVTNMSVSSERYATLTFIDYEQNVISDETIADDVTFENGSGTVRVAVELWRKQSGVGFRVNYTGTPASGYQVSSITTTPEDITVAAASNALLGSTITIPEDYIDVTGLSSDATFEIDISELLPDNVMVSSSSSSMVTVNVKIIPNDSKEVAIDVDKIRVTGLRSDLTLSYDVPEITLIISGSDALLESLTTDMISISIDASDLSAGDFNIMPTVELPAGYELLNTNLIVSVHVKENTESETIDAN